MLIKEPKSKIKGWGLSSLVGSVFTFVALGAHILDLLGPFNED